MSDDNVAVLPTTLTHIVDYVRHEGACEPGQPELVSDDPLCLVYKVPVIDFNENWTVPTPEFWYVCPRPVMNLYRNDVYMPKPWLPLEEQNEDTVIDYIKSFHLGLMLRMQLKG